MRKNKRLKACYMIHPWSGGDRGIDANRRSAIKYMQLLTEKNWAPVFTPLMWEHLGWDEVDKRHTLLNMCKQIVIDSECVVVCGPRSEWTDGMFIEIKTAVDNGINIIYLPTAE